METKNKKIGRPSKRETTRIEIEGFIEGFIEKMQGKSNKHVIADYDGEYMISIYIGYIAVHVLDALRQALKTGYKLELYGIHPSYIKEGMICLLFHIEGW